MKHAFLTLTYTRFSNLFLWVEFKVDFMFALLNEEQFIFYLIRRKARNFIQ
jgi:hypothetical protein